jgi:hypothetical protein
VDRPANLLGALALAVVDRTTEAVAGAAGESLSTAAALSALRHIVEPEAISEVTIGRFTPR